MLFFCFHLTFSLALFLLLTNCWGLEVEIGPLYTKKGFWEQAHKQCLRKHREGPSVLHHVFSPRLLFSVLPHTQALPTVVGSPHLCCSVQRLLGLRGCRELEMWLVWLELTCTYRLTVKKRMENISWIKFYIDYVLSYQNVLCICWLDKILKLFSQFFFFDVTTKKIENHLYGRLVFLSGRIVLHCCFPSILPPCCVFRSRFSLPGLLPSSGCQQFSGGQERCPCPEGHPRLIEKLTLEHFLLLFALEVAVWVSVSSRLWAVWRRGPVTFLLWSQSILWEEARSVWWRYDHIGVRVIQPQLVSDDYAIHVGALVWENLLLFPWIPRKAFLWPSSLSTPSSSISFFVPSCVLNAAALVLV